jgi:hypothetical protein
MNEKTLVDGTVERQRAQQEIIDFISLPSFQAVLAELGSLPEQMRHEFVELVLLDKEQLNFRGIQIPEGIHIQRSHFADNRPTLFCVARELPPASLWRKVTVTFDNQNIALKRPKFACQSDGSLHPLLALW